MALKSLIVCADTKALQVLRQIFEDLGIGVEHCEHCSLASSRVQTGSFDAIVVDAGDPYEMQIVATAAAVRLRLGWPRVTLCYQSRVGPLEWLRPYTDFELERFAKEGVKKMLVICPAFVSDCLETIEEIGVRGRDTFVEAGGKEFALFPCLNASPGWLKAMAQIVEQELAGWLN